MIRMAVETIGMDNVLLYYEIEKDKAGAGAGVSMGLSQATQTGAVLRAYSSGVQ